MNSRPDNAEKVDLLMGMIERILGDRGLHWCGRTESEHELLVAAIAGSPVDFDEAVLAMANVVAIEPGEPLPWENA